MMEFSTEPSLDCKPTSYSMLLKSFGDQQTDQKQKLEEILARLEEERLKIDAFKRELPLCMQLLTNAMEASRQQLQSYLANQAPRPVLEEFIPLKHSTSECLDHKVFNMSDKASWMTSAQLWSQTSEENKKQSTIISSPKETEIGLNVSPKLALDSKQWNGGAFIPFSRERDLNSNRVSPDLALNLVDTDMMDDKRCLEINDNGVRGNFAKLGRTENDLGESIRTDPQTTVATVINTANNTTTHTQRKARRCWSPDLHRRFVNALQMLGGSQVATPKQIRELMKVDGLTNDEVKSHLQKYRLHTRRPSPSPQATGGPAPQLVVLGGIWVPPEYTAAHGGAVPPLYSAHSTAHAPPYYSAQPMPQQFYSAPPPSEAVQHQLHLHHQLHMYQDSPLNNSFPESEVRGVGDSSESIEDGKSESGSWKAGESGSENSCGGERKGLASLRVKGE